MLIRLTASIFLFCAAFGVLAGSSDQAHAQALTAEDQKLDCPGVRAAIADVAVQIKRSEAQVRRETAAPPTTLAQMFESKPPTASATQIKTLRVRSDALTTLSGTKGCNRLDVMAKSRLGGAIVKPEKPVAERCDVRGELSLQDCAEDVAKWRCRGDASKGRAYLVCLEQTAERVITASGYDVTTLAHYEPGCGDVAAPATCSVFATNRSGPETKWCKRTSETTINVCDPPKAGTPAIATVADAKKAKTAAAPVAEKPAASVLPPGSICHPVPCKLGTSCNRLCGPPD
jgi:heat shock protein HslJ